MPTRFSSDIKTDIKGVCKLNPTFSSPNLHLERYPFLVPFHTNSSVCMRSQTHVNQVLIRGD